jgi:hypothetical protein
MQESNFFIFFSRKGKCFFKKTRVVAFFSIITRKKRGGGNKYKQAYSNNKLHKFEFHTFDN